MTNTTIYKNKSNSSGSEMYIQEQTIDGKVITSKLNFTQNKCLNLLHSDYINQTKWKTFDKTYVKRFAEMTSRHYKN